MDKVELQRDEATGHCWQTYALSVDVHVPLSWHHIQAGCNRCLDWHGKGKVGLKDIESERRWLMAWVIGLRSANFTLCSL